MEKLNLKQLHNELANRRLSLKGTKRILINRILTSEARRTDVDESEAVSLSESSIVDDRLLREREWDIIRREKNLLENERKLLRKQREIAESLNRLEKQTPSTTIPSIARLVRPKINGSIKDIADALPMFSPGVISSLSAAYWVNRVETLWKIYDWDERALLMAASSKMQGPARYWWDTTQEISVSWAQLSVGLKKNFPEEMCEIQVHQQMAKKTRRSNESIESCCFEMNMLGKRIQLSDNNGLNNPQLSSILAGSDFNNSGTHCEDKMVREYSGQCARQRIFGQWTIKIQKHQQATN